MDDEKSEMIDDSSPLAVAAAKASSRAHAKYVDLIECGHLPVR